MTSTESRGCQLVESSGHPVGSRVAGHSSVLRGYREAVLSTALALPILYIALRARRPQGMYWPHVYDFAHVALSLLAALVALRLVRRILTHSPCRPLALYGGVALMGGCLGGGIEILQIWGPGQASLADFARDGAGWIGGMALSVSIDVPPRRIVAVNLRCTARAVAIAVVGVALLPTAWGVWLTMQRVERLPILCDFEMPSDLPLLDADEDGKLTIESRPDGFVDAFGHVGKFVFVPGKPSGFRLPILLSDWSGYRSLEFDVFTQGVSVAPLEIRVHDRHHKNTFSDRFNTLVHLAPGSAKVSIPMEDILHGPVGRLTDTKAIQGVNLFMNAPSRTHIVYFDGFRLQ